MPELATRITSVLAAAALSASAANLLGAQTPAALRGSITRYEKSHDADMVRELADFLAIPNRASDSANIRRNAQHLMAMLAARGISSRLLPSAGGPPAVYGELKTPGATRTVVFYAHYDGQPVDTTQWTTPPWQPVLRDKQLEQGGQTIAIPASPGLVQGEWRLYARSASDDKAPIVAMLRAIDALRAAGVAPSVNLKFFFEGEEEAGSGHLHEILAANAELLRADAWLFGDGPVHQSRRQQIVFGVRGVTGVALTTYGPSHGLHSGHYGNWAPNPITMLANLVASMRDDDGKILIKHYYDDVDPITPAERRALAQIPAIDSALRVEVQLAATEAHDAPLVERIMLPALNLRGIRGGGVGATASNTIPTEATASIDFRLVPHETPERVKALVEAHAKAHGYFVVDHTPTPAERMAHPKILKMVWEAGYPATRVPMDSPLSRAVIRATQESLESPIVALPTLGGSLPMYEFERVLHAPLIVLPIVNHDNNQHSANENLRLQNLFDGVQVYAGVLARLGQYWRGPAS
ncbi:MAG TPA: M20/M25/M40 family metallo-hydrolase [Gemmatimonadaceae bacterium]|nr:M20/M25/M40 family metallo-hydrolase [Gemmatimonadaceae bacterium]